MEITPIYRNIGEIGFKNLNHCRVPFNNGSNLLDGQTEANILGKGFRKVGDTRLLFTGTATVCTWFMVVVDVSILLNRVSIGHIQRLQLIVICKTHIIS